MISLWTDGSAEPNPGPGGYAVLEATDKTAHPIILGKEDHTTNIRMEGSALRDAMKYAAKTGGSAKIHTDSEFWVNVLTKWAPTWEKNGWTKKHGEIKNLELVQELYKLYQTVDVELVWVRGHIGTEYNELADHWADEARKGVTL